MSFRRHRVVVGVVAGALLVGGAGLAAAAPGRSGPAAAPAGLSPTADPEGFVGVSPVRVLDTRAGDGPIGVPAAAPLGPGETIALPLTTAAPNRPTAPVPANAVSVLLNITIDKNASADSFITVWPTGQPRPNSSANNATPGQVTPNSIVVPLGSGGAVSIFNFTGNVDIAVDLAGYTVPLVGSSIQGPAGPQGPQGPQGVQGPQGPQGPMGPVIGAAWKQVNVAGPVPTSTLPQASVTVSTSSNFVVTASFRVSVNPVGTTFTCVLLDDDNIQLAEINSPGTSADEAITLTGVGVDTASSSLNCTNTGGTVNVSDITMVLVAVGEPLP